MGAVSCQRVERVNAINGDIEMKETKRIKTLDSQLDNYQMKLRDMHLKMFAMGEILLSMEPQWEVDSCSNDFWHGLGLLIHDQAKEEKKLSAGLDVVNRAPADSE